MPQLPDYERPPVKEVICGVTFKTLKGLLAPHLGILWDRFKPDYAQCDQKPPLAPVMERFDGPQRVEVKLSDLPPLPRVWFIHQNENGIIQIQQDRFIHNWRKVREADEYPRYETVFAMFQAYLAEFISVLDEEAIGEVEPLQYEMTYVNEMSVGEGWTTLADVGRLFPDLSWRSEGRAFLPQPEGLNCQLVFALPERNGRLHATVRKAKRREGGTDVLLLELTARGIGEYGSVENLDSWFGIAHEWIVRGFADLCSEAVQQTIWGRKR